MNEMTYKEASTALVKTMAPSSEHIHPMGNHLQVDVGLTYEEAEEGWEQFKSMGATISTAKDATLFLLGDMLNACQDLLPDQWSQLVTEADLNAGTRRNVQYVARQVPPENRHLDQDVTWSHCYEVAKFDPEKQKRLLAAVREENWSVQELRAHVKTELPETKTDDQKVEKAMKGFDDWWFQNEGIVDTYQSKQEIAKAAWLGGKGIVL